MSLLRHLYSMITVLRGEGDVAVLQQCRANIIGAWISSWPSPAVVNSASLLILSRQAIGIHVIIEWE